MSLIEKFECGDVVENRYHLDIKIHEGRWGDIYRGTDRLNDRPVAIRFFPITDTGPSDYERFEAHARELSGMTAPTIVTPVDHGMDNEIPYLVYRWASGQDMEDRLAEKGGLDLETTVTVVKNLLKGLDTAHDSRLTHGLIRPVKIIVDGLDDDDPLVKLVDFQIWRFFEWSRGGDAFDESNLSRRIVRYTSPEVLEDHRVKPSTDVYAVGLVAIELLTGQPAFDGNNRVALIGRQMSEEPATLGPDANAGETFRTFISKLVAKDETERFRTAGQALDFLREHESTFLSENPTDGRSSSQQNAPSVPDPEPDTPASEPSGQDEPSDVDPDDELFEGDPDSMQSLSDGDSLADDDSGGDFFDDDEPLFDEDPDFGSLDDESSSTDSSPSSRKNSGPRPAAAAIPDSDDDDDGGFDPSIADDIPAARGDGGTKILSPQEAERAAQETYQQGRNNSSAQPGGVGPSMNAGAPGNQPASAGASLNQSGPAGQPPSSGPGGGSSGPGQQFGSSPPQQPASSGPGGGGHPGGSPHPGGGQPGGSPNPGGGQPGGSPHPGGGHPGGAPSSPRPGMDAGGDGGDDISFQVAAGLSVMMLVLIVGAIYYIAFAGDEPAEETVAEQQQEEPMVHIMQVDTNPPAQRVWTSSSGEEGMSPIEIEVPEDEFPLEVRARQDAETEMSQTIDGPTPVIHFDFDEFEPED